LAPTAIEKIKILGVILEQPAKLHCQISPIQPIWPIFAVNGQCCLAGSCKTAPRILTFSITMGADYSFEQNSIETYKAPTFFEHNNLFLGSVLRDTSVL
jgi:hypothetical protein